MIYFVVMFVSFSFKLKLQLLKPSGAPVDDGEEAEESGSFAHGRSVWLGLGGTATVSSVILARPGKGGSPWPIYQNFLW